MRISICRYRLRFKRPFTTAHGTRDGTDAVFVRIEQDGIVGYGEATLPPYVKETADQVAAAIRGMKLRERIEGSGSTALIKEIEAVMKGAPAARNALTMAVLDAEGRMAGRPLWTIWGLAAPPGDAKSMVTLAVRSVDEVAEALSALPVSAVLKVKLGAPHDLELLQELKLLDDRKLLLDANQGLHAVDQALEVLDEAGARAIGIEQPFGKDEDKLHAELQRQVRVPVIGDESIQGLADLERAADVFQGVNVKLMKCGGLIEARKIIDRAKQLGMRIMLGSMSESTLGSLAMLHLSGAVDLLDLDGPWLLANDPFKGMELVAGAFASPIAPGVGALPVGELHFDPISP